MAKKVTSKQKNKHLSEWSLHDSSGRKTDYVYFKKNNLIKKSCSSCHRTRTIILDVKHYGTSEISFLCVNCFCYPPAKMVDKLNYEGGD